MNKNSFLCPDVRGQAVISVGLNGFPGEIATADADSEAWLDIYQPVFVPRLLEEQTHVLLLLGSGDCVWQQS